MRKFLAAIFLSMPILAAAQQPQPPTWSLNLGYDLSSHNVLAVATNTVKTYPTGVKNLSLLGVSFLGSYLPTSGSTAPQGGLVGGGFELVYSTPSNLFFDVGAGESLSAGSQAHLVLFAGAGYRF